MPSSAAQEHFRVELTARHDEVRLSSADPLATSAAGPDTSSPNADTPRTLSLLMVVPTLEAGAADAAVVETVRILRGAGHRVVVASRGGRLAVDIGRLGAEWAPLDVASVNPLTMLANIPRLVGLIRRHRCDVVHAHGRAAAWSSWAAARAAGKPFVTTWYKGFREQNPFKRFYNRVMVRGDRVVAGSDQIADLIADRYAVSRERVSVIPSGIDLDRFDAAGVSPARIEAARRSLGVDPGTKLVLVVGRMIRRKGHHTVIAAAQRLKQRGMRDFICVIASEDAGTRYAGEVWDTVLASDTSDCVRLAGALEDVPAAYAAADVVVSASIQHEGLSRAMLEAQAMARPVIVSDLGAGQDVVLAPPEVPEERATGLRFPAGDEAALAAALVKLFSMPQAAREAMGARGRTWVSGHFGSQEATEMTLRLYAQVAAPRADYGVSASTA